MEFELRSYQKTVAKKALKKLQDHGFVLLAMEVRLGKTHTSFYLAEQLKAKTVLFVTTKKTIDSNTITDDYETQGNSFELELINYESIHKIKRQNYDVLILDECHGLGAFPKPSVRARACRNLKERCGHTILMSGTPSPESYSQMYHILWGLKNSPWSSYSNFYNWARDYVRLGKIKIAGGKEVNDYSDGMKKVLTEAKPFTVSLTQKQAKFKAEVNETIVKIPMDPRIKVLIDHLKRHKVYKMADEELIMADTAVKLQSKVHQIASGTVKTEEGSHRVLDPSKAYYIHNQWKGKKIAIFYQFIAELAAIKKVFGDDLTTDIEEFQTTDKSIALQFVAGRSGISLAQAEALIFYNVSFSATTYWQARDRLSTISRENNSLFYIFGDTGFEEYVYDTLRDKDKFTLNHFKEFIKGDGDT